MIKTGFFNSINDDRTYKAEMFAEYFSSFVGNGIFPNPSTNLQVLSDSGMNIIIKPGKAWINGYYVHNDSDYTIKLDVADGVLRRIDRVVCRLSMIDREIQILVKKGTTSRAPSPPQLIRDVEYYELALADIMVNNGATQITQANITDTRLNNSLCGVVHGVVNQVDTTTIFNQYEGWFDEFSVDKEQEIQQFIDDLNALLDGDVASNLLGRLVTLENEFNTHKGESATLTAKGHVQLSNAINSTSQTLAATPYAVKQAYDLAQSAKTDGNNVKANTVSALLSVDDSLPITSSSSWNDVITQIGNISSGKKWATGTATASNSTVQFLVGTTSSPIYSDYRFINVPLDFLAKKIIVRDSTGNVVTIHEYNTGQYLTSGLKIMAFLFTNEYSVCYKFSENNNIYVTNNGFQLPVSASGTYTYEAIE